MTLTLPERTAPPGVAVPRAHDPSKADWDGGYREYRSCLRWDFAFTCIFCLRHETDIVPSGAEGWGVTSAEHVELQSDDRGDENDYTNVLYACKRCNRDRSTKPRMDKLGRKLLDPTTIAWGSRFGLEGDSIEPLDTADTDALYTRDAYDINAEKKRDARRLRAEKIGETLSRIAADRVREKKLVEIAKIQTDEAVRQDLLGVARELRRARREVVAEFVETYGAIPTDAAQSCRCDPAPRYDLPAWFASQCRKPPRP